MPNRLDLPSLVLTSVMVIGSIGLSLIILPHPEDYSDTVRVLMIIFLGLTLMMIGGCAVMSGFCVD